MPQAPAPAVLYDAMRAASLSAAGILNARFKAGNARVYEKAPQDIVTEADHEAEDRLCAALRKALPGCGFYTEESGDTAGDCAERWMLDPLDGTRNFSRGMPPFAVIIAYQRFREGAPGDGFVTEAGMIHIPDRRVSYFAAAGEGAYRIDEQHKRTVLRLSPEKTRPDTLIFMGVHDAVKPGFNTIAATKQLRFRDIGCSGAALAAVAEGKADALAGAAVKPWDVCAGALLVREAGGIAADGAGNADPLYGAPFVAGNGYTAPYLLECLSGNA